MDDLTGKRVALIGGAGFIGHNLALELKARGADVEVIDGLEVNHLVYYSAMPSSEPYRDLYIRILLERLDRLHAAGIPVHRQDARDYSGLSAILGRIEPDVIVHLAAVAHATRSNKDPLSTFDHSLRTLENALDFARGSRPHFVYLSSSMVYGNFRTAEVTEDHPLDPIGIYGALKVAGERMVIAYHQVFDVPYTIVRPSALYGPRCVSRRVGQIFIESALAGGSLRVDGDGAEKLDFTWIGDLVDGLVRIVTHPGARNDTFNLTAGKGRSIADLVTLVREHFPEIEVEYVERDNLRPFRGTLSVEKARQAFGYDPKTELEEGLTQYVAWYRELLDSGARLSPAS
jgi:nucleoside-diphosphate-sugar epimerase